ncbi:MAG TPA: cytochrome c biogenesis protein ResB, partial [Oxalicibacterium sp.]|nr:cytochrome c biogenesis protein ResB [Oxalicibacterium sp.]
DMRSWRDNVREQSLRNFHHKFEWQETQSREAMLPHLLACLAASGYKTRVIDKGEATLVTAKQGAANKWGYIFAHASIVIICIGGLLDSSLPIHLQKILFDKTSFSGDGLIANIAPEHRLGLGNPTFRGNTLIPEGSASNTAIIPQADGVLIQDLPFTIQLKRFIVDYYSTGMPKLFASDVVIVDKANGKTFPATIKVNQPLIYRGVAVYQSSFEDGGSKLKIGAYPMQGSSEKMVVMHGQVGDSSPLGASKDFTVEWSGFRAINVENMASDGQDVRAVNLKQNWSEDLQKHLGSAAKSSDSKALKNVGPSVQYKLRDRNGQAREYNNYMQPVQVDGAYVFLTGMRESPSEPFRYLRIPADDNDTVDEWMRLRAALLNPDLRARAAQHYAARALTDTSNSEKNLLSTQLQMSALRGLTIFAGDGHQGGYLAVSKFLEKIPPQEQEKAAEIFMKILNGSLWDLWQIAREKDGLPPISLDDKHGRFLQLATNAFSDSFFYGAPVYLQLQGFDEVKASVFQVTRSPGKKIVYFGCLLLVLGVFSMFYVRERRLWIWLKPAPDGAHAIMAMSSQRKTMDFEKEFDSLKRQLPQAGADKGER